MMAAGILGPASTGILVALIMVMNLLTAVQDIAVDGLAIDHAEDLDMSLVNAVQIVGFKVCEGEKDVER